MYYTLKLNLFYYCVIRNNVLHLLCITQKGGIMSTQFKKGIIELCVLKIISDSPKSAIEVIEQMSERINVNENTIYPILRRLTEQKMFETHKMSSQIGAPKKIYALTETGKEKLKSSLKEWQDFLLDVTTLLGGHYDKK